MSGTDWVRKRGGPSRVPSFRSGGSWKERPIDVRAEAARQVNSERRGQLWARRVESWREAQRATPAPEPVVFENDGTPEPPIRRRRKKDPGYPSRWYLWRGENGKAYVAAWNTWSYGLGPRPGSFDDFVAARERREKSEGRFRLGRRSSRKEDGS
jgi:hypothetical protein